MMTDALATTTPVLAAGWSLLYMLLGGGLAFPAAPGSIIAVSAAGGIEPHGLLDQARWTHPLTWVFQVMPIFFLVGGYSNALSWRSARRRGEGYASWLRTRLRRLGIPLLPLLLTWGYLALALWLGRLALRGWLRTAGWMPMTSGCSAISSRSVVGDRLRQGRHPCNEIAVR